MAEMEYEHKAGHGDGPALDHVSCPASPRMDQFQPSLADIKPNAGVGDLAYTDDANYCFNGPRPGWLSRTLLGARPPEHIGDIARMASDVMLTVGAVGSGLGLAWKGLRYGLGAAGLGFGARAAGVEHGTRSLDRGKSRTAQPESVSSDPPTPAKVYKMDGEELDRYLRYVRERERNGEEPLGTYAKKLESYQNVEGVSLRDIGAEIVEYRSRHRLGFIETDIIGKLGKKTASFSETAPLETREQVMKWQYTQEFAAGVK